MRYAITGANPGAGVVTTAADGTAAISWTGTKVGTDTLTAFVDRDGNGLRDVNTEPQQTATVTWTPAPPPVPGKSVVAKVVSGQVFIKQAPRGRARATGPPKGFVPFTGAANIPVGSQLDTSKGRVELTSAADTAGKKTQRSQFYDGIFQVKQSVPKKKPKKAKALITDLVMKGQIARSQCAPLKGARAAATKKKKGPKAVLGRLWGSGKGKFRTNGKYSAATVRGHDLAGGGSLRGDVDEGHARDGQREGLQAQEDGHREGRPQLPRPRPARREQEQALTAHPRCAGPA